MKFGGETLNRFKKGLPSALEVPCFAFVVLRKQFNFQSAVKRSMIFLFLIVFNEKQRKHVLLPHILTKYHEIDVLANF